MAGTTGLDLEVDIFQGGERALLSVQLFQVSVERHELYPFGL